MTTPLDSSSVGVGERGRTPGAVAVAGALVAAAASVELDAGSGGASAVAAAVAATATAVAALPKGPGQPGSSGSAGSRGAARDSRASDSLGGLALAPGAERPGSAFSVPPPSAAVRGAAAALGGAGGPQGGPPRGRSRSPGPDAGAVQTLLAALRAQSSMAPYQPPPPGVAPTFTQVRPASEIGARAAVLHPCPPRERGSALSCSALAADCAP